MSGYEKNQVIDNPVKVIDQEGRKFFCAPDMVLCTKFDCTPGSNRDIPVRVDELSEEQRRTCWEVSRFVSADNW